MKPVLEKSINFLTGSITVWIYKYYSEIKFQRLGKEKVEDKKRPIKLQFKEISHKKKFLSLLHKLAHAPSNLKELSVQHDLSSSERENLTALLDKAKVMNKDPDKPEGVSYKVRGPPFAFTIRKFFSDAKKD